jgi:hypothetical protein
VGKVRVQAKHPRWWGLDVSGTLRGACSRIEAMLRAARKVPAAPWDGGPWQGTSETWDEACMPSSPIGWPRTRSCLGCELEALETSKKTAEDTARRCMVHDLEHDSSGEETLGCWVARGFTTADSDVSRYSIK